jgi:glutamate racemase
MKKPIGVFDSGIGGLTILKELSKSLPYEDFIYFADSKNAPYGPKSTTEIEKLSEKIIQFLINKECKLIVIACNTATAAAVHKMREIFNIPIVGLEPAVKPACLNSKTGNVGVLATEGTFRGEHFKNTSDKYKEYVSLHLQVAKELVELAEKGIFDGNDVNVALKKYLTSLQNKNIDHIVLGCTHYSFFINPIKNIIGTKIEIIDSAKPVSIRTKDLLMTNKLLETIETKQNIEFYTSGNTEIISNVIKDYFQIFDPKITSLVL